MLLKIFSKLFQYKEHVFKTLLHRKPDGFPIIQNISLLLYNKKN